MGGLLSTQINPNSSALSSTQSSNLLEWRGDVSRVNFKFMQKL
jgi:hypothetical protein